MSTTLKLASDILPDRDATGTAEGSVGDTTFKGNYFKVNYYNNVVQLTLASKQDEGGSTEVFLQFPDKTQANTTLIVEDDSSVEIWVSFNTPPAPYALELVKGELTIDQLTLSPFKLSGRLFGDTESPAQTIDIAFDVTL